MRPPAIQTLVKKWPGKIWMHNTELQIGTMIHYSKQSEYENKGFKLGRLK
jgi:hypothetical protein